jgi:hypothetical protein
VPKLSHRLAESHRRQSPIADAQHQAFAQGILQRRPHRRIERSIEVDAADRRRHRLCQFFTAQRYDRLQWPWFAGTKA